MSDTKFKIGSVSGFSITTENDEEIFKGDFLQDNKKEESNEERSFPFRINKMYPLTMKIDGECVAEIQLDQYNYDKLMEYTERRMKGENNE